MPRLIFDPEPGNPFTEKVHAMDVFEWDRLMEKGEPPECLRPFGPSKQGSPRCQSGSLASGGTHAYCTCDTCF